MRKKTKRPQRKFRKAVAIFVDGKTESWYFQSLKKYLSDTRSFEIKPELPKKKSLTEIEKQILEAIENDYDKVYWLVDLDKIIQDNKITTFRRIYNSLSKKQNISILINNPCLEIWFLLHFRQTKKQFADCNQVAKELKKYLPEYTKHEKFFLGSNNDIFKRLYPQILDAIKNAKLLEELDFNNINLPQAQIYKIFEELKLLELVKGI